MSRALSAPKRVVVLAAALMLFAPGIGLGGGATVGQAIDRCDREMVELPVALSDVQGTTFTGTYRGDTLGALGVTDGLMTYWSVDRVYAGGPLPSDLVIQTPACAWANLTPGVRYLFSTAATDIAVDEDTGLDAGTGMPSVNDSLAWAIGPDDAISLAPFDAYTVDDYGADVRAIASLREALEVVAPDSRGSEPPGPPTEQGLGGCAGSGDGPAAEQARGTTFVGRYIGDMRLPAPSVRDVRVYWAVERVYAGGPLPEVLTMRSDGCFPVTLEPGHRYLFSTADVASPSLYDSLAWRLSAGGAAKLATFGGEGIARRDWRTIDAFDEALRVVAPDAQEGEPPLRSRDRTPG